MPDVPDRRQGSARWQRRAGNLLVLAGCLVLLTAATSVARGAIARESVRTRWAQREAQRAVVAGRLALASGARPAVARGAPIARLVVPRLDLDEVVVEGVTDAALRAGPGHMTGSPAPGDSGNSVISAHRDRHFRSLGRLAVGDTIHTESDAGNVVWTVTRIRVVHADAPALWSTRTPTLTLTTCWPLGFFGSAPDRLIVEAAPIG